MPPGSMIGFLHIDGVDPHLLAIGQLDLHEPQSDVARDHFAGKNFVRVRCALEFAASRDLLNRRLGVRAYHYKPQTTLRTLVHAVDMAT